MAMGKKEDAAAGSSSQDGGEGMCWVKNESW